MSRLRPVLPGSQQSDDKTSVMHVCRSKARTPVRDIALQADASDLHNVVKCAFSQAAVACLRTL